MTALRYLLIAAAFVGSAALVTTTPVGPSWALLALYAIARVMP